MSNLKKKKICKNKEKKERNSIEIVKTLSVFATSRSLSNRCPLTLLPARWRFVRNEQDSCDRSRYLNRTNYIIEIVSFFCFFGSDLLIRLELSCFIFLFSNFQVHEETKKKEEKTDLFVIFPLFFFAVSMTRSLALSYWSWVISRQGKECLHEI